MDAQTINQTIELLPFVGDLRKAGGGYHVGPCPMCGGVDRFTVKHTPGGDRWHCRQCGDGKYHGVIDFIMARDRVSFVEACKLLTGATPEKLCQNKKSTTAAQPAQPRPAQAPDAQTQARMMNIMDMAADDLEAPNLEAQAYLFGRGLTPATWEAWHIGAALKGGRMAITLPWYYMDATREIITGIKYRFVDGDPGGQRYTAAAGSVFVLYGAWSARKTDHTVMFLEGEINALSLWQCLPRGVTVLSIGSQSGGRPEVIAKVAARYKRVFFWCDEADKTREYKKMIAQDATGIQSPTIDGAKYDANTLLLAGQLPDFITQVLKVECQ